MIRQILLLVPFILAGCSAPVLLPPPPAPAPVMEPPLAAAPNPEPRLRARARTTPTLDIWMLNVGQGTCTYVKCPDETAALVVDCGTSTPSQVEAEALAEWMNDKLSDVSSATLLVSHGDKDHLALLKKPLRADLFGRVLLGGVPRDYTKEFLSWSADSGVEPTYFETGAYKAADPRFVCPGARVDLLTVNASWLPDVGTPRSRKNADSAVMKISYGENSAVLTGDAESITELSVLDNAASAGIRLDDITLLTASHHGSNNKSNVQQWIDAIKFRAAVFSSNVSGSFHHPHCKVMERIGNAATDKVAPFPLDCGLSETQLKTITSRSRLLSTSANGTIQARFLKTKAVYRCERMTPACDEQLDRDELP